MLLFYLTLRIYFHIGAKFEYLFYTKQFIYTNNCPTRCNIKTVYLLFYKFTVHVSGLNHTHHQEYAKL